MQAISNSLGGINRAMQQLNTNAATTANEGPRTDVIVDDKIQSNSIKANLAAAKTIMDTEDSILDILA